MSWRIRVQNLEQVKGLVFDLGCKVEYKNGGCARF